MAKVDQKDMRKRRKQPLADDEARKRLLAELPVIERWVQVHDVSTAVLEGGDGPRFCCCMAQVGTRPAGCA